MNKPRKRNLFGVDQTKDGQKHCWHIEGYNQACDDWEEYHNQKIDFYTKRFNALQKAQRNFDPSASIIVCNILANGAP